MLNKRVLDYRSKQKILYTDKSNQNVLQDYGNSFLEQGLSSEALEFYQRANDNNGLQKIKDMALNSGDVMLFQQTAKALRLELKPADWEAVGKKAMELKKYFFARHALEKANNEPLLDSLKKLMQSAAL